MKKCAIRGSVGACGDCEACKENARAGELQEEVIQYLDRLQREREKKVAKP